MSVLLVLLLTGVVVGMVRWAYPASLFAAFSPSKLLEIGPSPKQSFAAHPNEAVTAAFTVSNISPEAVTLLGANTSCACTVVMNDFPIELKPHESTKILMRIDVGDHSTIQKANLLVDREGIVPQIIMEAKVANSP
jgi:hypothetical protein